MPRNAARLTLIGMAYLASAGGSVLGAPPAAEAVPPVAELRAQVAGWYEADGGRRLTILPEKKKLVAVFDWANGAPTSVGRVVVYRNGEVAFKQAKSSEKLGVSRSDGGFESLSILDLEFERLAGTEGLVGDYTTDKGQKLTVSLKGKEIYGSIDWANNAPKSNGWLRAGANGETQLVGHKWSHDLTLGFADGAVQSIGLIGQTFTRVPAPE